MLGNSAKIAELQEQISKLEADLKAATADKTAIQAELDTARASLARLEKAQKLLDRTRAEMKSLRAALVKAADGEDVEDDEEKAKKKAEGEEDDDEEDESPDSKACAKLIALLTSKASVDKQVTARLAAAGVDPVKRDPAAAENKPNASLPPRQRAAAAMSGWGVFAKN